MSGPRIALLGLSIECNRFAPPAARRDFTTRNWFMGEELLTDARAASPRSLGEMQGFVSVMDATGPWEPVPIFFAAAEPNGPIEQGVFEEMLAIWREGLRAMGKVDAVYATMHGAAVATGNDDPEGTVQALVKEICGADVPLVCTYDLHANVSDAMVRHVDGFVGYRTNPHVDMRPRGEEAGRLMLRILAGEKTHVAMRRLPIVSPPVALLTAQGPYAEVIDLGQERQAADPRILNVSAMGGFAFADTPYNGFAVVVTATEKAAAEALAQELAEAAWARRDRFVARLTSLAAATEMARSSEVPLIFADVADNPGGGGRGTTMWVLEAFLAARVQGALFGIIHDPPLAAEAHALGQGMRFNARFNREGSSDYSRPLTVSAKVRALSDGKVVGRRGLYAGLSVDLGPTAALDLGGIVVVVVSERAQCADPVFFEHLGLDIGQARAVVVKSRGHFRAGFDMFPHERVIEVDAPGLTSPVLTNFNWTKLPRPVLPLDPKTSWSG